MSRIEWTEPALGDVKALRGLLKRDSEPLADQVTHKIFDAVEQATAFPRIGREVAEVDDDAVREFLYRTFRIVYRAERERIVVLGVLHGGRPTERREPRRWEVY